MIREKDNSHELERELEKVKSGYRHYREQAKELKDKIDYDRDKITELNLKVEESANKYNLVVGEKRKLDELLSSSKKEKQQKSKKKNNKKKVRRQMKLEGERKMKEEEKKTKNKQGNKNNNNSTNNLNNNNNNNIINSKNTSSNTVSCTMKMEKSKQLHIEQKRETIIKKIDGEEITIAGSRKVKDKSNSNNKNIDIINILDKPCTAYIH